MSVQANSSRTSPGARVAGTLFFGVFALMGTGFLVFFVKDAISGEATHRWTPTPCQILRSGYQSPSGATDGYRFKVAYRYSIAGREYNSEQFTLKPTSSLKFEPIQRAMIEFAPGKSARCYVNPANPSEAVLEHASRTGYALGLVPLIFMLIGFGGIWFMWRPRAAAKPVAISAAPKVNARKFSLVFFGAFLLIGGILTVVMTVPTVGDFIAARSWTPTPATVVSSRITESNGDASSTYGIDVLYSYDVAGTTYLSNRYKLVGGTSSGRASKQRIINGFRPGTKTTAYVNPADPVQAVLVRDFTWDLLLGAIPVAPMLIGLIGLVATVTRRPTSQQPMWSRSSPAAFSTAPIVLSSGSVRRGKFIALLIVALFWNAISWGIAIAMWKSNSGTFAMIFIGVFVLVGLALFAGAIHAGLAMLNPSVEITFSHSPLRLGEGVTISWRFSGNYNRVSRLRITLEGREQARYRRGTDTVTDKQTFFSHDLVDTTRLADIPTGKCPMNIPAQSMHSFDASDNKIVWYLLVKGDIPNWPDVSDEFTIQVLPLDLSKRRAV